MGLLAFVLEFFAIAVGALLLPTPALASRAELHLVACHGLSRPNFPDRVYIVEYAVIETDRAPDVVTAQWKKDAPKMEVYPHECNIYADRQAVLSKMVSNAQKWAAEKHRDVRNNQYSSKYSVADQERPWSPQFEDNSEILASPKRTKSVFFEEPNTSLGDKGFAGVVFDVEYQFIACLGELHIAYSLVEDSVGIGRLAGGGDRVAVNGGRGRANYWLDGKVYKVDSLPEKIVNLPLKGSVWAGHQDQPLGRFADDHAGKALGFGCFSGQTKKIANLDELKNDAGKVPTKDELPKIFEKLRVNFATNEILTSAAAEENIRSGLASKGDSSTPKQANADRDVGPADAELRAQQRAAKEAEFQAKQAEYEKQLAAQQKAVADFDVAQQQVAADKAANAVRAKAAQDQFAQQQAAHQAELERHAKAQADYEAQVAGQASVKDPRN